MRILLAAGKTGGHIFPALALAQEFKRQDSECEILLVGSREKIASKILNQQGITWQGIDARPLKGTGIIGKVQAMAALVGGLKQAQTILNDFQPQIVIGLGGYSCAPLVMATAFQKIPCFLQEQNFIPGMTNRYLGRFVKKIFTSFADSDKFFPVGRTIWAGNPVRSQMMNAQANYDSFGLEAGIFTVMLFGGSQGAHQLNLTMLEALKCWPKENLKIQIIHQTGEKDFQMVKDFYAGQEIKAYVNPFIDDMATAYATADLVVCRAGATSIAELTQVGKPSILIPYPYAANDHQTANARYLADKGAALMIPEPDLDGQRLAQEIEALQQDADRLHKMASKARDLAKPEAAQTIVNYLVQNYAH